MKKILIFLMVLFLVIALVGCNDVTEDKKAYKKCTSVCASVLGEDYTTLYLCNEECKNEFLNQS